MSKYEILEDIEYDNEEMLLLEYERVFIDVEVSLRLIKAVRGLSVFEKITTKYTHEEILKKSSKIDIDEFIKSIPEGKTLMFKPL